MLTTFRGIVEILRPRQRRAVALAIVAMTAFALLEVVGVGAIAPFLAVVSAPDASVRGGVLGRLYHDLGFTSLRDFQLALGTAVLSVIALRNVVAALATWFLYRVVWGVLEELSSRLLRTYLERDYEFFLRRHAAELSARVLNETESFSNGLLFPAIQLVSQGIGVLGIVILLVIVDPALAGCSVLALGGAYALIYLLAQRRLATASAERLVANAGRHRAASDALLGAKEVKVAQVQDHFVDRFSVDSRRLARLTATWQLAGQLPRFVVETVAFGGLVVAVLVFILRGDSVEDVLPVLGLYAFAGYRLVPAVQQLFASATAIRFNTSALDALRADLHDDPTPRPSATPLPFERGFELRGVSYTYPTGTTPALDGIDVTIGRGATVGIAGTTGSGKSTLLDVILGLLPPSSGELVVDGAILDDEAVRHWQRTLSFVPQHIHLYEDTLLRNIAFGVPDVDVDVDRARRAADGAGLRDVIVDDLPDGLETMIGDRGVRLSGGQRQRVGLARALYREAPILVLDEATSALDGKTERAVLGSLLRDPGRTTIMVAHRLSTLESCDVILLVEGGHILDRGTHAELLAGNERFRSMLRRDDAEAG